MKNKFLTSILAGTFALAGAIGLNANDIGKPYESPEVKKEWKFNIVEKSADIFDDSKYPKIEGDNLMIVGYGSPSASQDFAKEYPRTNAYSQLFNLTGSTKLHISGMHEIENEIYTVTNNERPAYIHNSLFEIPLSNFRDEIKRRITERCNSFPVGELGLYEHPTERLTILDRENKDSETAKYIVTNLSADLMIPLFEGLNYKNKLKMFKLADKGYDGKTETGKEDNMVTGAESEAFRLFMKSYVSKKSGENKQ